MHKTPMQFVCPHNPKNEKKSGRISCKCLRDTLFKILPVSKCLSIDPQRMVVENSVGSHLSVKVCIF